MSKTPFTMEDLKALIAAGRVIEERSHAVSHYMSQLGFHIAPEALAEVITLTGAQPEFTRLDRPVYQWAVAVRIDGVKFEALFRTAELKLIGYHVPGWQDPLPTPVPIEPVQTA